MDSPRTCSQKQPRTTQNSPKRPRAAPQRSPKPPRTAQSSPAQPNHRFACICMHFYDALTLPGYKRLCFTDVFEQAMHFLSIFTINLIRRPLWRHHPAPDNPRCKDKENPGPPPLPGKIHRALKFRVRLRPKADPRQREPWACALTGKNAWIPTDTLTNPMFNCM